MLLVRPFPGGDGSIEPKGMRYTLKLIPPPAAALH
jgi:hypothetical protein